MSDIFDEVDEILNEVDGDSEESSEATVESNFNESELMDIMAEIENLEKEFVDEVMDEEDEEVVGHKESLQEAIDRELQMSLEMSAEKEKILEKNLDTKSVLAFEKKSPIVSSTTESSEISFQAQGQMNLNLGFKIGQESATLTIDPVNGLTVVMNGVSLCINDEVGCHVTMENGVTFTIPLTSSAANLKKKSA